ncbi:MAG: hypothetical protein H7839_20490 [Magnetococcus sp. YQC-5]
MDDVALICYWRNKTAHGYLRTTVKTSVPMKHLKACPRVASCLEGVSGRVVARDRDICLEQLMVGIRTLWFMQATGVRPSRACSLTRRVRSGVWVWNHGIEKGIDHAHYWRTPDGVLVMSNEPYAHYERGPWNPFAQVRLPKGHGMWNPPSTTLFLLAKPEHQHALEQVRDRLFAAGPMPEPRIKEYERRTTQGVVMPSNDGLRVARRRSCRTVVTLNGRGCGCVAVLLCRCAQADIEQQSPTREELCGRKRPRN